MIHQERLKRFFHYIPLTRGIENLKFKTTNVLVRFKNNFFNELIRKKQFTELDFLSFAGGLLGLFAGVSALSLVEVIYWFTIRVIIDKFWKIKSTCESKLPFFASFLTDSSVHGLKFVVKFTKLDR